MTTVGPAIADEYARVFGVRPSVVLNAPYYNAAPRVQRDSNVIRMVPVRVSPWECIPTAPSGNNDRCNGAPGRTVPARFHGGSQRSRLLGCAQETSGVRFTHRVCPTRQTDCSMRTNMHPGKSWTRSTCAGLASGGRDDDGRSGDCRRVFGVRPSVVLNAPYSVQRDSNVIRMVHHGIPTAPSMIDAMAPTNGSGSIHGGSKPALKKLRRPIDASPLSHHRKSWKGFRLRRRSCSLAGQLHGSMRCPTSSSISSKPGSVPSVTCTEVTSSTVAVSRRTSQRSSGRDAAHP